MLILYGTEYGCSEEVSRKLFDRLTESMEHREAGVQPRVVNARDFQLIDWEKEQLLLCVFSTTGDGNVTHMHRAICVCLSRALVVWQHDPMHQACVHVVSLLSS